MQRRILQPLMLLALLGLALAPHRAAADLADALKLAPADAHIVVVVKSVDGLNAKVAVLAKKMGMGEDLPPGGAVEAMTSEFGVKLDQLDKTGPVLLVIPELPAEEGVEPKLIVLFPVKDYKAFTADNNVQTKDGKETFEVHGKALVVAPVGKFAAVSDDAGALNTVVKKELKSLAGALSADENELAGAADIFVHANAAAIYTTMKPKLDKELKAPVTAETAGLHGILALVQAIGQDAESADAGVTLSDAGVDVRMMLAAKDGSVMAQAFSTAGKATGPVVGGVPVTNFLLIGGVVNTLKRDSAFAKRLADVAAKSGLPAEAEQAAKVAELRVKLDNLITRQSFVIMAGGTAEKAALPISVVAMAEAADGPAAMTAARAYAKETIKMLAAKLPAPTSTAPEAAADPNTPKAPPAQAIEYAEAAETVAGVKVDKMTLKPEALAGQLGQFAGVLPKVLGDELVVRMGVKGNALVVALGGGAAAFEEALKAAEAKTGLDKVAGVQKVKAYLAPDASAVFYMAPDKLINIVMDVVGGMMGAPMPAFPKVDEPIAASLVVKGKAAQARLFVPAALLEAIGKYTESMKAQMGGGPPPGPGGKPVPPPPPTDF